MLSTEVREDLYFVLTTVVGSVPPQLWLLFSSYYWLILLKGNGERICRSAISLLSVMTAEGLYMVA